MSLKEKIVSNYKSKIGEITNISIKKLKENALQVFNEKGFPTIKDEDWKYTSLKSIVKNDFELSIDSKEININTVTDNSLKIDSYKVVIIDGKYNEDLSDSINNESIEISSIASKISSNSNELEILGSIAPANEHFVALNTLTFNDGAFIKVAKNKAVDKAIEIFSFTTVANTFSQYRNLIVTDKSSEVTIVEKHINLTDSNNFSNNLSEISVGENSNYYHYKVQNDNELTSLVDNVYVDQKQNSNTYVDTFSFGGNITRNNLSIALNGENSVANFNGINLLTGNQHVDNFTYVDHLMPNCDSHELYKGIYDGKSKGVFRGKIFIHKDAQNTNGNQQSSNIVLSEDAQINAKPQLEIYADDVKASHGCTIGQLDEDALFFLRSRGIPKKEAKALMMFAFASEALENVKIPELNSEIKSIIANKLDVSLDFD